MSELTKRQEKGIDLVVKSLRKRFPFIKGWELSEDNERFQVTFFIELLIDFFEMAEFYGKEIRPAWARRYRMDGPKDIYSSSLAAMIDIDDGEPMFDGPTFNEMYENNSEIKKYLANVYGMLPDEFKIVRNDGKDFFGNLRYKDLSIDNYKQYQ